MLCKADGTQVRVESRADAEKALEAGLTLLPTTADPHDGGTPNVSGTVLPQPIQDAIASTVSKAVEAACPPAGDPDADICNAKADDPADEDEGEGEGNGKRSHKKKR
jgi:hypothetical protein